MVRGAALRRRKEDSNPRGVVVLALLSFSLLTAGPLHAQPFPTRPIHLVVPFAPGGGVDISARIIGQKLAERLGVGVVVDNRPGAGGVIGSDIVAKSPPDGYTLMLGTPSPLVIAPWLLKKMPYDPQRDLTPITIVSIVPAVLAVLPTLPAHTVKELVALAKSHPGQITYASSGNGGTAHLAGLLLQDMAGVNMVHVPFRGTGPALTAVMSGETTFTAADIIAALPMVKGGRLRALAVTGPRRSPVLPAVPAVAETLPGYAAGPFYGVLGPGHMPPELTSRIRGEIVKILQAPDMKARLSAEGGEPVGSTPEEYMALIKAETTRWGRVIRKAGNQPE
jgi:tripartite-type tricarboxylate transporter receptor subunit TctC